ncbi:peptidoglycan DD-metalloendopeptidase family protein [Rhodobacteraceae bacterium NNCM2]|nr:peptidoglycan DD-metalloendopeptidase family protein [Coraliihabitans acroporae]
MKRLFALLLCGLFLASGARGADFPEIDRARALLADAETSLNRARGAGDQLVALGKAVKAQEAALAAFHSALRSIALEDEALMIGLGQDRIQLAEYLAALQSISRAPKSALLVFPGGPVRAARAAIMIGDVAPRLEARMALLRDRLDEIRTLRALQEEAREETRAALAGLQDLRVQTTKALRGRRQPPARSDLIEQAKAAQSRASDLDDLAMVLRAADGERPSQIPFAETKGALLLPVNGVVTHAFGEAPLDRERFGVVIEAPAYAQVTAPVNATVRYAGPLVGFNEVVVLEPESGWLMVIAGLGQVDRAVGEAVLAGEKIGDLGGPLPTSEEFLTDAGKEDGQIKPETVYIELRQRDTPVDPAPWFALDG